MKHIVSEDQSQNGVSVKVTRAYTPAGEFIGSTVDASCQCFGHPRRVHSNIFCSNLVKA